jgi:hypothetical protein
VHIVDLLVQDPLVLSPDCSHWVFALLDNHYRFAGCFTPTRLWSADDDHYITQLNPDGSTRDFVDYDSNLIACAFGVAGVERCHALLRRIDGGRCAHARATFVSEKWYGRFYLRRLPIWTGNHWCGIISTSMDVLFVFLVFVCS